MWSLAFVFVVLLVDGHHLQLLLAVVDVVELDVAVDYVEQD